MDVTETRLQSLTWDGAWGAPADYPGGDRHEGGVSLARALVWNVGTFASMQRENLEWRTHEGESTDAGQRGGSTRSSDEAR
jgi:hypothetical protein